MSIKLRIAFTDLKTRGSSKKHDKSTFLCYADGTLETHIVLADGTVIEVSKVRYLNMQLSIVNDKFRIELPQSEYVKADGEKKWIPTCFPQSAITRNRYTNAMKSAYVKHEAAKRVAAAA